MAVAAAEQQPTESAAEIIAELARARNLPRSALRRAFERANEVAPAVIDVVEQAARGVFLMPGQHNLLFWGIHAVAAAQRTELHRPLLDLTRRAPPGDLVNLLGGAISRTLKKAVISTFDGDPEPVLAACADKNLNGFLRWDMMLALARLTFDGRIPRATTVAFVDRFERESLAGPGDAAWEGWQDVITFLGLEDMRERLRASWSDGRNPQEQEDPADFERRLSIAQALAPGDDALFSEEDIVPLGNPEHDLEWMTLPRYERDEDDPDPNDPVSAFALKELEIDWLDQFLSSSKVPPATMTLEQVDGLFSALIAGPPGARVDDCLRVIWNADDAAGNSPSYDTVEQEQYVQALLRRYWTTIAQRLDRAYPHAPVFIGRHSPREGRDWAGAFLVGMAMREMEWTLRSGEENIGFFIQIATRLALDRAEAKANGLTWEFREQLVKAVPKGLIMLHHAWRGRADPFPRTARVALERKVGRNEPCPCGSGKKYKRCCGSPDKRPSS